MWFSGLLPFLFFGAVAGEWSQFDDQDLIYYRTVRTTQPYGHTQPY